MSCIAIEYKLKYEQIFRWALRVQQQAWYIFLMSCLLIFVTDLHSQKKKLNIRKSQFFLSIPRNTCYNAKF